MWLSHPDMNVSVTANFDVNGFDMTPDFQHTGTWYNYMTGEELVVNQTDMTLYYEPGQYYIFTDQPLSVPDTAFVPEPGEEPDGVNENSDPLELRIYPNPTTGIAYLDYVIGNGIARSVEIRDLTGRLIKTLDAGTNHGTINRVKWDGTSNQGTSAANGQYIISITTDRHRSSKMLVLSR